MKTNILLHIFLIGIFGFIVYGNTLNADFIWDDYHLVKDNAYIKNWSNISRVFTEDIATGSEKQYNYYRPLQMLTYMVDYSIWKLNVFGYHLTNTLLHITAAICIYLLINLLFSDRILSLFMGILFVIHPVHTEAVSFISGRADSLALIFATLSFILYIKCLDRKSTVAYLLMILCYVAALLSRENSLILPALILLYHYSFRRKIEIKTISPFVAALFIYILSRFVFLGELLPHAASSTTFLQRLPGVFASMTDYIRLLFLPFGLHAEYGNRLFSFTEPKVLIGIVLVVSLLLYSYKKRSTNRLFFFSVWWFFIALLPVSNIYPLVIAYMAEHWLYLPCVGFFLLLSKGFCLLYRKGQFKAVAIFYAVCLLGFFSFITILQNTLWNEPVAFYERNLQYNPTSLRALNALGMSYMQLGQEEKAVALYKRALKEDPSQKEAYYNLGVAYNELGQRKEALEMLKKAVNIDPGYGSAYNALGVVYRDMGDDKKAMDSFEKATRAAGNLVNAYLNLASQYAKGNRKKEAIKLCTKAIHLEPESSTAHFNLGNLYRDILDYKSAIRSYRQAIKIKPDYLEAHVNLGIVYAMVKDMENSIAQFKKAIEIDPGYSKAHNNLGFLYAEGGRNKEAIEMYKQAIKADPSYAKAYENLAIAYYNEKEYELSIQNCDKAKELGLLNPDLIKALGPHR